MPDRDAFEDFFYESRDGLTLHARIYGEADPNRLPVVCLPGLTRNARDFHALAVYLSRDTPTPRRVVAFDYRGRGLSAWDPTAATYTVAAEAADIIDGLSALGIGKAAFIGTSRGGLIVHVIGAVRPDLLGPIVLNDIGPVIEPEGLALIRAYLAPKAPPESIADAVARQKSIHEQAFPALSEADWLRMTEPLYRIEEGRLVLDFDPALVGTIAANDPVAPLPTLWPQFEALRSLPMLVLRGENSRLLSRETVREMQSRHADLQSIEVSGQGHAPLLETGGLPKRIHAFLERADP